MKTLEEVSRECPKLVRDRIPEKMAADFWETTTHFLRQDPEAYRMALAEKLAEELAEYCENPSVGELVDIIQVVRDLTEVWQKNTDVDIEAAVARKAEDAGTFSKGCMLLRVTAV